MSLINDSVEVIIKLGGCAITHKNEFETENVLAIKEAAKIIDKLRAKCIVVHGAG